MTEGSSLWSALFSVVYGLPSLSCRSHGVIRAGLLADFIVLAENPFETDVERIHAIEASATIVAGELRSGSL